MKYCLGLLSLAVLTCGSLFADNLSWGSTYAGVWSNFGTSPYTAVDASQQNLVLKLYCLDFNDEIAPPIAWQATILPLNQSNVTNYSQFGGNYGNGITPTAGGNFAFTGDTPVATPSDPSAAQYAVTMSSDNNPYTRYLEAAWLFSNINQALLNSNGPDVQDSIISQVAAWDLFVEARNQGTLESDITGTSGAWSFQNYVYSANNYQNAPTTQSGLPTSLTFEEAVDEALNAAQNAVANGWASSPYMGNWELVTGTQAFVNSYGIPVQEFLSPTPAVDSVVPEPAAIILLGSVMLATVGAIRRKTAKVQA